MQGAGVARKHKRHPLGVPFGRGGVGCPSRAKRAADIVPDVSPQQMELGAADVKGVE